MHFQRQAENAIHKFGHLNLSCKCPFKFENQQYFRFYLDEKQSQKYRILLSIVCTFYIENDAEIFPAHYTRKVAEKMFKMIKLAIINIFCQKSF
jgi:hypothetical protein